MQQDDIMEVNKETLTAKERYELLIKARNFHYENFNKWMAYFYVMIGSIVLGFSYIISKDDQYSVKYHDEILILSLGGFTISLLWHWANKGYYYWNINFITLINHYEKNILELKEPERIYFVFANKAVQNNYLYPFGGANISTSKISIILSYLFALFFGAYGFTRVLNNCIKCEGLLISVSILATIFVIGLLSFAIANTLLTSNHKHFPDLKIDSTKESEYIDNNNFKT